MATPYQERTATKIYTAIGQLSDVIAREGKAQAKDAVMSYSDLQLVQGLLGQLVEIHKRMEARKGTRRSYDRTRCRPGSGPLGGARWTACASGAERGGACELLTAEAGGVAARGADPVDRHPGTGHLGIDFGRPNYPSPCQMAQEGVLLNYESPVYGA